MAVMGLSFRCEELRARAQARVQVTGGGGAAHTGTARYGRRMTTDDFSIEVLCAHVWVLVGKSSVVIRRPYSPHA